MRITGRALWIKIKNGFTLAELASSSNMSEEKFLKYLEDNFQKKSVIKMLSQLNKNQKSRDKHEKRNQPETIFIDVDVDVPDTDSDSAPVPVPVLSIQNRIDEISRVLCSQEVERENLLAQKRDIHSELADEHKTMLSIQKQLKEHEKKVLSSIDRLDEIAKKITMVNTEISSSRELLTGLREELKSLQRISIFAYANGEIEFEPKPKEDIEIPDSSSRFQELLSDENLYDFTLNHIKQLAKCISIADMLRKEDREFEITFENEKLLSIFESLI